MVISSPKRDTILSYQGLADDDAVSAY